MEKFSEDIKCPKCGYHKPTFNYCRGCIHGYSEHIDCICTRCQYEWAVMPIDSDEEDFDGKVIAANSEDLA